MPEIEAAEGTETTRVAPARGKQRAWLLLLWLLPLLLLLLLLLLLVLSSWDGTVAPWVGGKLEMVAVPLRRKRTRTRRGRSKARHEGAPGDEKMGCMSAPRPPIHSSLSLCLSVSVSLWLYLEGVLAVDGAVRLHETPVEAGGERERSIQGEPTHSPGRSKP